MATTVSPSQLDGLFKEVYGDAVENLIPEHAILQKDVKFESGKKLGDSYHVPVVVTAEHGVTYAAHNAGAFAINTPIALTTKDAQVTGSQMLLASRMSYDAAMRAVEGGKSAFVSATDFLVKNMLNSMAQRAELAMLYGGVGLGKSSSSSNVDSTHTVVTLTTASWAAGIWSGAENAQIQFYTAVPALVSSGADSVFTIDSVDVDNRTLTLSGTSTGITALDSAIGSGTCDIYWYGAYGNEMSGLDKIITNTGTLFNISAATYNLWKGNSHTVTGQLTFKKLLGALNKAVSRGLMENVKVYVNPLTWADLAGDLAALRTVDQSYSAAKIDQGSSRIVYHGINGLIEIVPHACVKEGECFAVPTSRMKRIGASDITFNMPGDPDNRIFIHLQSNAGFELRCYADFSLFVETPAKAVKVSGFTNSTI